MKTIAKSMTIRITQEVIDKAVSENSSKCMIAQALRKAGAMSTNVTAEHASFNMDGIRYTYPLPAKAAVELIRFDENKSAVLPFQFTLDGRTAFMRPVTKRPNATKRGPTKTKTPPTAKRCVRRFHGLRVIETVATQ